MSEETPTAIRAAQSESPLISIAERIKQAEKRIYQSLLGGLLIAIAGVVFNTVSRGEQLHQLTRFSAEVSYGTLGLLAAGLIYGLLQLKERSRIFKERELLLDTWRIYVPTAADGPELPQDGFGIFEAVTAVTGKKDETLEFITHYHTWSDEQRGWITTAVSPEQLNYAGPTSFDLDTAAPRTIVTQFADYCFAVTSFNRKVWLAEQMAFHTPNYRKLAFSLIPAHRDIISGI